MKQRGSQEPGSASRNTSPRALWQGPRLCGVTAYQAILKGRERKKKLKGDIWIIKPMAHPLLVVPGNPDIPTEIDGAI